MSLPTNEFPVEIQTFADLVRIHSDIHSRSKKTLVQEVMFGGKTAGPESRTALINDLQQLHDRRVMTLSSILSSAQGTTKLECSHFLSLQTDESNLEKDFLDLIEGRKEVENVEDLLKMGKEVHQQFTEQFRPDILPLPNQAEFQRSQWFLFPFSEFDSFLRRELIGSPFRIDPPEIVILPKELDPGSKWFLPVARDGDFVSFYRRFLENELPGTVIFKSQSSAGGSGGDRWVAVHRSFLVSLSNQTHPLHVFSLKNTKVKQGSFSLEGSPLTNGKQRTSEGFYLFRSSSQQHETVTPQKPDFICLARDLSRFVEKAMKHPMVQWINEPQKNVDRVSLASFTHSLYRQAHQFGMPLVSVGSSELLLVSRKHLLDGQSFAWCHLEEETVRSLPWKQWATEIGKLSLGLSKGEQPGGELLQLLQPVTFTPVVGLRPGQPQSFWHLLRWVPLLQDGKDTQTTTESISIPMTRVWEECREMKQVKIEEPVAVERSAFDEPQTIVDAWTMYRHVATFYPFLDFIRVQDEMIPISVFVDWFCEQKSKYITKSEVEGTKRTGTRMARCGGPVPEEAVELFGSLPVDFCGELTGPDESSFFSLDNAESNRKQVKETLHQFPGVRFAHCLAAGETLTMTDWNQKIAGVNSMREMTDFQSKIFDNRSRPLTLPPQLNLKK